MESTSFQHPSPFQFLESLGQRCMVHTKEGGGHTAYLDFGSVQRIEYEDATGLPDLLDAAPAGGPGLPLRCGFLGYELVAANFGVACLAKRDLRFPAALLARPATQVQIHGTELHADSLLPSRAEEIQELASTQRAPGPAPRQNFDISPNLPFEEYARIFDAAREHILEGNTYQIKISIRYTAEGTLPPLTAFGNLMAANPAPEAFVLKWDDFSLVCCSPETVLIQEGHRPVTRPVGGTIPRDVPDAQARLLTDAKETAEHNMLIDLERNDLSRICEPGSVRIEKLREVETYAHLHHLVSTIAGDLIHGTKTREILAALLPGGTITGCPKHRTVELIDQLEPCFRGPYTGSFGTFHDNGDLRLNLIIRTLAQMDGRCHVQAGRGIVIGSTPEYEYRENQLKAQALLDLLGGGLP